MARATVGHATAVPIRLPINSRRRIRDPDGSTNERMRHCRLEQYHSHQMNDPSQATPSDCCLYLRFA
jgi:hypothetical protein